MEVNQILKIITAKIEEELVGGNMCCLRAIFHERFQTSMNCIPLPDFSYTIDYILLINDEFGRQ